jgi:uncharacterized membrane protein (UPF0127 family)
MKINVINMLWLDVAACFRSSSLHLRRLVSSRAFAILLGCIAVSAPRVWVEAAEISALEISTAAGKTHRFAVELAVTPDEQQQGLMFRRTMAADTGMLFLNDPPRAMTMWMRNTFLPLDMIFFDARGRVTRIVERTVPHSEAIIPSGGTVRGVLEVNAGTAARLGLKPGDRLVHPAIEPAK